MLMMTQPKHPSCAATLKDKGTIIAQTDFHQRPGAKNTVTPPRQDGVLVNRIKTQEIYVIDDFLLDGSNQ